MKKGAKIVKFKMPTRQKKGHRVPFQTDEEAATFTQDRRLEKRQISMVATVGDPKR